MKWFRIYSEMLNDLKVQRLEPEVFKHWVNLLCVASEAKERGHLPYDIEQIAFKLRISPQKATEVVGVLKQAGLLDQTDDGLIPHNWYSWQCESDNSTERVRKHREKQALNGNVSETGRNVTETDRNVSVTPQTRQDKTRSDPDPDPDLLKTTSSSPPPEPKAQDRPRLSIAPNPEGFAPDQEPEPGRGGGGGSFATQVREIERQTNVSQAGDARRSPLGTRSQPRRGQAYALRRPPLGLDGAPLGCLAAVEVPRTPILPGNTDASTAHSAAVQRIEQITGVRHGHWPLPLLEAVRRASAIDIENALDLLTERQDQVRVPLRWLPTVIIAKGRPSAEFLIAKHQATQPAPETGEEFQARMDRLTLEDIKAGRIDLDEIDREIRRDIAAGVNYR